MVLSLRWFECMPLSANFWNSTKMIAYKKYQRQTWRTKQETIPRVSWSRMGGGQVVTELANMRKLKSKLALLQDPSKLICFSKSHNWNQAPLKK